jgi:3-hydroxyisobutyrate dehydrogenase-like beta-hydroxyacid dehydrogenase
MKIGFIGFGEAAFNLATGLKSEGLTGFFAYDAMENDLVMGKLIKNNAEKTGATLVPTAIDLVQSVDIIISAVPSTYTLDVCNEIKEHLRPNQIYVDVSASTTYIKEQIWNSVKDKGVLFVDAAMMGSLPKDKHRVPITASGNGAEKFKELMTPYNMQISTVGEKAGTASAIKLIRSIFMKGISALMIETLQAADAYDVTDEIVKSISKSMDGIAFTSHLDRLVIGSAIHCKRRADELKGSIEMLEDANLDFRMTIASMERLKSLEKYDFAKRYIENRPSGYQEIIESIRV